jgi:hypothetical protein
LDFAKAKWKPELYNHQVPLLADNVWSNGTDAGMYDAFGRSYFLSLSLEI